MPIQLSCSTQAEEDWKKKTQYRKGNYYCWCNPHTLETITTVFSCIISPIMSHIRHIRITPPVEKLEDTLTHIQIYTHTSFTVLVNINGLQNIIWWIFPDRWNWFCFCVQFVLLVQILSHTSHPAFCVSLPDTDTHMHEHAQPHNP